MGKNSRRLYGRALSVLAGGVNSSVRAEPSPYPFFVQKGDGGDIVDVDGNRYTDYVMGYGPLLLGHDLPERVAGAVQSETAKGPMYGAPTEVEVELAEFVADHVESVETLRFVNSGTEATVSAVRLARGVTGRDKVVVMRGGYHGAQDSTLVEGDAEHPKPGTKGVPESFARETIPVPFNDDEAVERVFEKHCEDIACVLVEPILGNNGVVRPVEGYHGTLRRLCDEHGSLLIFDEVITGFRVGGLGCAQSLVHVEPDLTTFGKIVGGGFPVGAVGGPSELVEGFTPTGDVFQAGTFSGHPVTMTAGLETLRFAKDEGVYDHVNRLADELRAGMTDVLEDYAPEYTVVGVDSVFKTVFTRETPETLDAACDAGCEQSQDCPRYGLCPKDAGDIDDSETERWKRLYWTGMLDEGFFLTPNQFESQFVCWAHDDEDVDETLEAYERVVSSL
jgi:glutamate-1-semialdehyde 2,1-aminomutase